MCGIVGYIGSRPVLPLLVEGLRRLEYRGYDSAGVAVTQSGGLIVHKRKGKVRELESILPAELPGTLGIAHTRWATHGAPSDLDAHPLDAGLGRLDPVEHVVDDGLVEARLFPGQVAQHVHLDLLRQHREPQRRGAAARAL